MPIYPIDYKDDSKIRATWGWQTRYGMAPHFPGTPIGSYQCMQAEVEDKIVAACRKAFAVELPLGSRAFEVRHKAGKLWARLVGVIAAREWKEIGSPDKFVR